MLSGSADLATTLVGSPGYLAPELCSGEPYNEKADIWALGVTLIELCALKHPFGGAASQAALVMKIMGHTAPPPLPQGFSQQLSRVLATCMARHSAHRPSALQLLSVPLVYQKAKEHNLHSLVPPQASRHAQHIASTQPPPSGGGASCPPPPPAAALSGGGGYAVGAGGNVLAGGFSAGITPPQATSPQRSQQHAGGPRSYGARVGVSSSADCGSGAVPHGSGVGGLSVDAERHGGGDGGGGNSSARGSSHLPAGFQSLPFQRQQPPRNHAQRRAGGGAGGPGASSNGALQGVHEEDTSGFGGWPGSSAAAPPAGVCRSSGCGGGGYGGMQGGYGSSCNGHSSYGAPPPQQQQLQQQQQQHMGATRETPSGVSWSIKPVCADRSKRTAPMRKSWHALNYPNAAGSTTSSLGDATCGPGEVHRVSSYDSVGVPARTSSEPPQHGHHPGGHQPPYGHHHHGGRGPEPAEVQRTRSHEPLGEGGMGSPQRAAPHPAAGKGGGAPQRGSSHLRSASEGIAAIQADAHATPHTPPSATTLWAKRRGPDASPGSQTDLNLQLISIKGNDQWQDLQSPLDVFARKHCPSRSRPGCSSSEHHGPSALGRPSGLLCETDEEGHDPTSPSWDRPNNHSPLAALLRREFPSGKPQSERRLFDDL